MSNKINEYHDDPATPHSKSEKSDHNKEVVDLLKSMNNALDALVYYATPSRGAHETRGLEKSIGSALTKLGNIKEIKGSELKQIVAEELTAILSEKKKILAEDEPAQAAQTAVQAAYEQQLAQDSADPGWNSILSAFATQESGAEGHAAENERTEAYGTFQIMPSNWESWSTNAAAAYGLPAGALADSSSAANQYLVARVQMQKYHDDFSGYGDDSPTGSIWGDIAAAWYTGRYRVVMAHKRKAAENAGEEYTASEWEIDHCSNGNCLEWVTQQGTFTPNSGNCPEDEGGNLNCAPEPAVGSYVSSVLGHAEVEDVAAPPAAPTVAQAPEPTTGRGFEISDDVMASWAAEYGAPTAATPDQPAAEEPAEEAQPDQETLDALAFGDDDDRTPSLQGVCPEGFIEIKGQCVSLEKLLQALAESQGASTSLLTEDEEVPEFIAPWDTEQGREEAYERLRPDPLEDLDIRPIYTGYEQETPPLAGDPYEPPVGSTPPQPAPGSETSLSAEEQAAEDAFLANLRDELEIDRAERLEKATQQGIIVVPSQTPQVPQKDYDSFLRLTKLNGGDIQSAANEWREQNPGRSMPAIDICTNPDGSVSSQCVDTTGLSPSGRIWPYRERSGRPYHPLANSSQDSDRMMRELGVDVSPPAFRRPPEQPQRRRRRRLQHLGGSGMPGIEGNCPGGYAMIMGRCIDIGALLQNLSEQKQNAKELVEEESKELFINSNKLLKE